MLILKVPITIYDDEFYLLLPRGPTLKAFFSISVVPKIQC